MMIRALLIDLDGVIRIWDGSDARMAEAQFNLPAGTMARTAFESELVTQAITGVITDEEWRRQVGTRLSEYLSGENARQAVAIWSSSAGRVNERVLDLVRACRGHANVVLVSNATTRLLSDLVRLNIDDEFDAIINSSEFGFAKPEPEIYQIALDAASVTASQAMFVDDRPQNVVAAKALGMAGYDFVDADSLQAEMMEAGLI